MHREKEWQVIYNPYFMCGFLLILVLQWLSNVSIVVAYVNLNGNFTCACIYLSIHSSIHSSIHPSVRPSVCWSVGLSIYPSIHLSIYLSIYLTIYLSISPCPCMYVISLYIYIQCSYICTLYSDPWKRGYNCTCAWMHDHRAWHFIGSK